MTSAAAIIAEKLKDRSKIDEWKYVPLKGKPVRLPVIEMRIDRLRYNPDLGRLILERFDHSGLRSDDEDIVQEAIRECIEADKNDFRKLREQIEEDGQLEPGICTADGTLINGNRRKTVLHSLLNEGNQQFANMRVAVLGDDVEPDELYLLEVRLQMTPDTRKRYGPITTMVQIRKGLNDHKLKRKVLIRAMDLGSEAKLRKELRILDFVDEYLLFIKRKDQYRILEGGEGSGQGKYEHFVTVHDLWKKHQKQPFWENFKLHLFQMIRGGASYAELRKFKTWRPNDIEALGQKLTEEADSDAADPVAPGAEGAEPAQTEEALASSTAEGNPEMGDLAALGAAVAEIQNSVNPEGAAAAAALPAPVEPSKPDKTPELKADDPAVAATFSAVEAVQEKIAVEKALARPHELLKKALTNLEGVEFAQGADKARCEKLLAQIEQHLKSLRQKLDQIEELPEPE